MNLTSKLQSRTSRERKKNHNWFLMASTAMHKATTLQQRVWFSLVSFSISFFFCSFLRVDHKTYHTWNFNICHCTGKSDKSENLKNWKNDIWNNNREIWRKSPFKQKAVLTQAITFFHWTQINDNERKPVIILFYFTIRYHVIRYQCIDGIEMMGNARTMHTRTQKYFKNIDCRCYRCKKK